MNKTLLLVIGALLVFSGTVFFLRFGLGGNEDDWICVDGKWVKHGMPSSPMPTTGCGEPETTPVPSVTENTSSEEQIVGGDRDEHGCIGSAGYRWCEVNQKCQRLWEEPCGTDQDQIKQALVDKNNWSADEIKITVNYNDGEYASGGVGSVTPGPGGGIWFAAKVKNIWNIVYDGNGVIPCENLEPYPEFPTDLIPECYNQSTGQVVKR